MAAKAIFWESFIIFLNCGRSRLPPESLIFIDQRRVRLFLTKMDSNVLAAQLDLIFDALALAGKLGLAGIDDVLLRLRFVFRFHSGTSSIT